MAATSPATTTPAPAGDGEKGTKGKGTAKKVAATGGILAMLGLGGCWVLSGDDDSPSETPSATQGEETEVGLGESEPAEEPVSEPADEPTEEVEEPVDEPEVASAADGDERTLELMAAGQPLDMSDQATYDSSSYAVIGSDVPSPLLEVQASLFSIDDTTFAAISGPSAVLNESTYELDRYTGNVQSPDGIDLVGANAAPLPDFPGGLPLPEAGGESGLILLPFDPTVAETTAAGVYVGTMGMSVAEGTFAAVGGKMPLTEIPVLSQQFRQALEDRLNKTGSSVSDLILTVTPVIFTSDD